ncbi:MAG: MutS-related protein [Vicinamibacterales bacterium]
MRDPKTEYEERLHARRVAHAALTRRDALVSYARVTAFAAAALFTALAARGTLSPWWIAGPVVVFLMLVIGHGRVIRARETMSRAMVFYERGLARIDDRWAGAGEPGERFRDPEHPYSLDLDLFGPASLFELLSLARTPGGEEALASWLTTPAIKPDILLRQQAIAELGPRLDLREELSSVGAEIARTVHGDALRSWGRAPAPLPRGWARASAVALSLAMVAAVAIWAGTGESTLFLIVVLLEIVFWLPVRRRVTGVLHSADGAARQLTALATVLERLERERFASEGIRSLQAQLTERHMPASMAIRRLRRLVELHDWEHNVFFAPVAAAVLWSTHVAYALEGWRRTFGDRVATWLQVSGDFEALASLSAYHFEHPADSFPEILDGTGPATFHGTGLGHPLIPASKLVRNDLCLDQATQLLVVSGSNMSGKSTLLRTVGVASVMALAGAPVRAGALRLTPLRPGATLRIQDSLQEGRSRFYAEISRIRALSDLAAGPPPLLFLLDELFHGTNSHDRVVGAAGVLRALLDRGAIGLITTHDLAVTQVVGTLGSRAANIHFEDQFEGGEIRFDYRIKPGPVTHSNAVALMRAVGLDVPDPS